MTDTSFGLIVEFLIKKYQSDLNQNIMKNKIDQSYHIICGDT
jgi:hypothetical protein